MIKNKNGFSLIEIIIGIAIVGILFITIIPLITMSFIGTTRSGKKSDALYKAQQIMENRIAGVESGSSNMIPKTLTIDFGTMIINIDGQLIHATVEYDSGKFQEQVKSFIPD